MSDESPRCKSVIELVDDYDGTSVFRCRLPPGHVGEHRADGTVVGKRTEKAYLLVWIEEHIKEKVAK